MGYCRDSTVSTVERDDSHRPVLPVGDSESTARIICRVTLKVSPAYTPHPSKRGMKLCCPGVLQGQLILPPLLKTKVLEPRDGMQTLTVTSGQQDALEVTLTPTSDNDDATRFYLSPDDTFHVPYGHGYSLKNHSREVTSVVSDTLVIPFEIPAESRKLRCKWPL